MISKVMLIATLATFSYLIVAHKPLLAATVFAAGFLLHTYLKRRIEGIVEDERTYAIGEKASRFALVAFTFFFGIFVILSEFLRVFSVPEEIIGTLSASVGLLLLLYIAGYAYYSWRLS